MNKKKVLHQSPLTSQDTALSKQSYSGSLENNGNNYQNSSTAIGSTLANRRFSDSDLDWHEATKNLHCPICDKPDWCYLGLDGNSIKIAICGREVPVPNGWVKFGESKDNRIKYRREIPDRQEKAPRVDSHKQYIYTDTEGNPLIRVNIKYRNGEQLKPWQEYFIKGQWLTPKQAKRKGIQFDKENKETYQSRVALYNWEKVKTAIDNDEVPVIPEGEPCVDALAELGITATTNLMGSRNWCERYAQELKEAGAKFVIVSPDRDKPGVNHANQVADSLERHGIQVAWLYPFGDSGLWNNLPNSQGLDVKDLLEDYSMSKDELFNLVELQRRQLELTYQESNQKSETKSKSEQIRELIHDYINATDTIEQVSIKSEIQSRFKISKEDFNRLVDEARGLTFNKPIQPEVLTGKDLFSGDSPGIKWLVPGLLPIGGVTILGANSGQGKTTLAYDCAGAVHFAEEFLGERPTKQGKVLILSSDEPKHFAIDKLANRGFSDEDNIVFVPGWTTNNWELLEQLMSEHSPDLVIIDSFNSIHSDENFDANSDRAAITINQLNPVLERYDAACLLIHHLSKSKENEGVNKLRNSTAIAAASSMIWSLEGENEVKTFKLEKTRGTEPLSLKVKMDAPNGKFNIVEGAVWDDETKSLGERIIGLFESLEPNTRLEFQEIKSYITGNEHSLRKGLERLTKLGTLNKGKSSVNKRRSVWYLPSNEKAPPSPCSDEDCPNEAGKTNSWESQTLDIDSTNIRQDSTELDSLNSPNPESPSKSESQTLDRQPRQEGGEYSDNNLSNKPDIQEGDTIKYRDWMNPNKIISSQVEKLEPSGYRNGSFNIHHEFGSFYTDTLDDVVEVINQWGQTKWKR
ncbi:MAG: AAA family ATPase [Halothece sp.]